MSQERLASSDVTTGSDSKLMDWPRAVAFASLAVCGMPNKPVLPTATSSLIEYAPGSLRRQTGQPLDT